MDPIDEPQHHLQLRAGDVGRYAFVPGDPGRCELIARYLDGARHVRTHREYTTWTGLLDGELVAVTSTGIGGPSAAIAVEELAKLGVDTFVRVGTSGSMQPTVAPGDVVVVQAAIRDEGTTRHYLPVEFPAVANLDVTNALVRGARASGAVVHVGVAQSKDSYYGQHEPARMPVADRLRQRWDAWRGGGALCSEMEAASLFVVASVLGLRAGAIMQAGGHYDQSPMTEPEQARCTLEELLPAAVRGMREIIAFDRISDVAPAESG
jgi:uridine phosphorylase